MQAGALYRLIPEDSKQRLVEAIAGGPAQVSRADVIERAVAHFTAADKDYGRRVAEAVARLRAGAAR